MWGSLSWARRNGRDKGSIIAHALLLPRLGVETGSFTLNAKCRRIGAEARLGDLRGHDLRRRYSPGSRDSAVLGPRDPRRMGSRRPSYGGARLDRRPCDRRPLQRPGERAAREGPTPPAHARTDLAVRARGHPREARAGNPPLAGRARGALASLAARPDEWPSRRTRLARPDPALRPLLSRDVPSRAVEAGEP